MLSDVVTLGTGKKSRGKSGVCPPCPKPRKAHKEHSHTGKAHKESGMKKTHAPAATKEHSAKKTPAKKTATKKTPVKKTPAKKTATKKPAAAKKPSAKATATKHHAHHAEPAAHTHAHAHTHSGTKKPRATSRKKPSGVLSKVKAVARKVGEGMHTVAKAGRKHLAHVINVKRRKTKHGYEKRICLVIPD